MTHPVPSEKTVFARRVLFASLCLAAMLGMLALAIMTLSPGGIDAIDMIGLVLLTVILPWVVIGFWNAVIGFIVMRFSSDPDSAVLPLAARVRSDEPITTSTAILMCVRNEPPARVVRNLRPMLAGLAASEFADKFHLYLLSDTNDAASYAEEEAVFDGLIAEWRDRVAITYRRRDSNAGFKAGNVRDFCERWGSQHDFAVTLDADSFMSADAIIRLVRIMQLDPKLGILQGLIIGLPSTSLFARVFQFGMRLGMRSYTLGSAWWQADCGPYWGHNALIRLAPFTAHCHLPTVFIGDKQQQILSHDQIEAVLMRAAGFDVRVLPREDLGWEDNPPNLLEFMRRDLRWCQGNMQYRSLLSLPGLKLVSRMQLLLAILMFLGSPAWIGMLLLATVTMLLLGASGLPIDPGAGKLLLAMLLVMWFGPKIARALDILIVPAQRRAFGGALRFVANLIIETVYSFMLSPVLWISHTIFLVGLLFDHEIKWMGQTRDDQAVTLKGALRDLWPHTLVGCTTLGLVAMSRPSALPYVLLVAGGPALSVPFAWLTARPGLGKLAVRLGIGQLPEERSVPDDLVKLNLPALRVQADPELAR